jgi:hypothetical protein
MTQFNTSKSLLPTSILQNKKFAHIFTHHTDLKKIYCQKTSTYELNLDYVNCDKTTYKFSVTVSNSVPAHCCPVAVLLGATAAGSSS